MVEKKAVPHDHDDDHEHDEQGHVLWKQDRIELRSVGIDIGSSTSHLIFSTLVMRRQGATLSSRFQLSERIVSYESPILLTPFVKGTSIDTEKLSAFFDNAYKAAGVTPKDIDTGAVITTGDAARKDNAAAIVQIFSEQSGQFVCASAGPMLEAKMAAYGSGAVLRSAEDEGSTVLNIDVGGGTAKLAIVKDGKILETTAINVGARLITFDDKGIINKIEPAAQVVAKHRNFTLEIGKPVTEEVKKQLALGLAESLLEVGARRPLSHLAKELLITGPLSHDGKVDTVQFSGGVSEYIYGTTKDTYADIGVPLAREINALVPKLLPGVKLEQPSQRIRATVIGASQFTVQVSGNTIYIANPKLLPQRNLQVVAVAFHERELTTEGVAAAVRKALVNSEVDEEQQGHIALAVHWPHGPAFARLEALTSGIAETYKAVKEKGGSIVIVLDSDLARLVGSNLSSALGDYKNVICIDGVQLQDFDYVDLGEEHEHAHVVTVVIKSLVFTG